MTLVLRLTKDEKLTFEELDGNFTFLSQRITNLEVGSINWQEAYSWGNHSLQGYLTYYEESDPVFTASPAYGISDSIILKWNSAFDWGNHALAGYLTTLNNENLGSLFDVDLNAQPNIDNVLKWNGEKWVAGTYDAFNIDNNDITSWNLSVKQGDNISLLQNDAGYITTGLQTGDNVSELVNDANYIVEGSNISLLANDAGYLTTAVPVWLEENPPTNPTNGDLWWDTNTGVLKIYYLDADTGQWVDAVPQANSNLTALQAGDNVSELTNDAGYLTTVPGTETYLKFGTSTSFNPGNVAVTFGNVFQQEGGGDIEISLTVTTGFTKTLVTLDAVIWNVTDSTTESQVALERQINTGSWTLLRQLIFPVTNTYYGNSMFQLLDTHGASAGDTVKYRIRNSMDVNYSSESLRLVTGMCGDTIGIKEIQ